MRIAVFFLLLIITFSSCTRKETPTIKPDVEQFFEVYMTFLELSRSDSLQLTDKSALMDSALSLHGMDEAVFDTTLTYLEKHPDIFLQAFEKFDAKLREQQLPANQ